MLCEVGKDGEVGSAAVFRRKAEDRTEFIEGNVGVGEVAGEGDRVLALQEAGGLAAAIHANNSSL